MEGSSKSASLEAITGVATYLWELFRRARPLSSEGAREKEAGRDEREWRPIAILDVFYGRYVRDLSKKTQTALDEITKVAEERNWEHQNGAGVCERGCRGQEVRDARRRRLPAG